MRINDLILEKHQLDDGIGSFLGRSVGGAVNSARTGWNDFKQGYKDASGGSTATDTTSVPPTSVPPAPVPPTPVPPGSPPPAPPAPVPPAPVPPANTRMTSQQARQEVDQAITSISKVRPRDKAKVVDYAASKIDALRTPPAPTTESKTFHSNFLGMKI